MTPDPVRILDDPSRGEEIREALGHASRTCVDAPASPGPWLERFRVRLQVGSAPSGVGLGLPKAIGLVSGLVLVGAALVALVHPHESPAPPLARAVAPVPTATGDSPTHADDRRVDPAPAPCAIPDSPAPARSATRAPSHPSSAPKASSAGPATELDELAQVSRLRRLVRTDPREALRLADEMNQTFPHGLLKEEREALAVEALVALGEGDAARARASRFLEQYPRSPYADRIREDIARGEQ